MGVDRIGNWLWTNYPWSPISLFLFFPFLLTIEVPHHHGPVLLRYQNALLVRQHRPWLRCHWSGPLALSRAACHHRLVQVILATAAKLCDYVWWPEQEHREDQSGSGGEFDHPCGPLPTKMPWPKGISRRNPCSYHKPNSSGSGSGVVWHRCGGRCYVREWSRTSWIEQGAVTWLLLNDRYVFPSPTKTTGQV